MRDEALDPALLSRIDRVYDYIQDHLSEKLSVDRLAEVAIVSPGWFQRIFLAAAKETPAQFIQRIRIERAANLLLIQKTSSIANIALDCGFGSAELLTRHFKNRFGFSPSEWRKTDPAERCRRNRQVLLRNGKTVVRDDQGACFDDEDILNKELQGRVSALRLERRPERRVIYTRHFRGYEQGIADAFERLKNWAAPRGLIGARTITIGMGLDNPQITAAEDCRFLACLTVEGEPEVGEGIGTRLIPAGLYAMVEFEGLWSELSLFYSKLFRLWLPRAGTEGVSDFDYFEYLSTPLEPRSLHCMIALQVRSL